MQYIVLALLMIVTFSGAARADCEDPAGAEGVIIYNADYKTMQFCNGTAWISMSSILPTGMPKSPSFYATSDAFNGSQAEGACDSGFHMCFAGEWIGRSRVADKGTENFYNLGAWIETGRIGYRCNDWTDGTSTYNGNIASLSNVNSTGVIDAWQGGYVPCNNSRPVLCCSD